MKSASRYVFCNLTDTHAIVTFHLAVHSERRPKFIDNWTCPVTAGLTCIPVCQAGNYWIESGQPHTL